MSDHVYTVRVAVRKEEGNESEPWSPPTHSEVVAELVAEAVQKDFDLGWIIEDIQ